MTSKQKGFTLIEMLIAVAIFAFISVIVYSFLNASLKTTSVVNAHSERLSQLQKTLHFLQRDASQLNQQGLSIGPQLFSLRTLQNEQLLNITYKINNNQLIRVDFSDLNSPVSLGLLKDVSSFKVQALTNDGGWKEQFTAEDESFIKALKIEVTHHTWGVVETIVIING